MRGEETPGQMAFWQTGDHEIDFVTAPGAAVEIKLDSTNPLEFAWFPKTFSRSRLIVIGKDRWAAGSLEGMTLEDFLLADPATTVGRPA